MSQAGDSPALKPLRLRDLWRDPPVTTIPGADDDEMVPESRWWRPKTDVPVDVDVPEVLGLFVEDALPGIVSAAVMARMPTAATAATAIHVVSSLSRPMPTSRAVIRASVESTSLIKTISRKTQSSLRHS